MAGRDQGSAVARFDTIDLRRGFSVLSVVLLHCSLWLSFAGVAVGHSFPRWLRYVVFSSGGNGVSAFFAISGFLITVVSLRRFGSLGAMPPRVFYRMRFARIAPMLGLLLLVLSGLHLTNLPDFHIRLAVSTLPRVLFAALTFQLNWFEAVHGWLPAPWTVLWSLSVEEMFYLFFPLLCVGLLNRRWGQPVFIAALLGWLSLGLPVVSGQHGQCGDGLPLRSAHGAACRGTPLRHVKVAASAARDRRGAHPVDCVRVAPDRVCVARNADTRAERDGHDGVGAWSLPGDAGECFAATKGKPLDVAGALVGTVQL